jgi:hypothetical protein
VDAENSIMKRFILLVYPTKNIIWIFRSERIDLAGRVAYIVQMRGAYNI